MLTILLLAGAAINAQVDAASGARDRFGACARSELLRHYLDEGEPPAIVSTAMRTCGKELDQFRIALASAMRAAGPPPPGLSFEKEWKNDVAAISGWMTDSVKTLRSKYPVRGSAPRN